MTAIAKPVPISLDWTRWCKHCKSSRLIAGGKFVRQGHKVIDFKCEECAARPKATVGNGASSTRVPPSPADAAAHQPAPELVAPVAACVPDDAHQQAGSP